jgi:hypothetical protein
VARRHPRRELPDLAGADDEDLVLHRPGPQQQLPVGGPVPAVNAAGTAIDRGPAQGHDPVHLGEAEVVADGEAQHRGDRAGVVRRLPAGVTHSSVPE